MYTFGISRGVYGRRLININFGISLKRCKQTGERASAV